MNKGTKEGTEQEIDFVKLLNKKEQLSYWKIMDINCENHYAIRVIYKTYGELNESKIYPKADIFIATGNIPDEYIKSKDYFLDEDDVNKFNLIPVSHSGISVKRIDSTKYQIMKMSPSTFKKLFGTNILASGSSIYCNREAEFVKNINLLKAWGIKEKEFIDYFNSHLNIHISSVTKSTTKDLKTIKDFSNKEIAKKINNDKKISDFIFFGIGNFHEPYTATWLFEYGEFKENYIIPFTITTGSGRSKGIYTIVLKPK